jgi:hypothetical protein
MDDKSQSYQKFFYLELNSNDQFLQTSNSDSSGHIKKQSGPVMLHRGAFG